MMELFFGDDLSKHPLANLLQLLKMLLSLFAHPCVLPEMARWKKRTSAMLQPPRFIACLIESPQK